MVDLFKVSSTTRPEDVARSLLIAIRQQVDQGESIDIRMRAIGVVATNTMLKAVIIARGQVSVNGIDLAVIPAFHTIVGNDGHDISAVGLRLFELSPG